MQGTFDFEFIGDFFHQFYALRKITVFRQIRKPADLAPIHLNFLAQGDGGKNFGAILSYFILSRVK